MRKLISFKIGGSGEIPVYSFEWQAEAGGGLPEVYRLKSTEPPDPALRQAAHEVAKLSAKMVSLNATDSDIHAGAGFHSLCFEYPKSIEGYKVRIKAEMEFPWNGYTFKYQTPAWRVYYGQQAGDFNNMIRDTIHALMEECWKYIDGSRAQVPLFDDREGTGD